MLGRRWCVGEGAGVLRTGGFDGVLRKVRV